VAVVVAFVALVVPSMVVGDLAALAIPVACIVELSIMARLHPMRADINGTSPIAVVPPIVAGHRVPVVAYPGISHTGTSRLNPHYARPRGRADSYPDGKPGGEETACRQQRQYKQFKFHV